MKSNYLLWGGFLFVLAVTIVSLHVPFFWDVTYFAHQADTFYTGGYTLHPLSAEIDTGGFPLYASWMYACWKFFGRSLAVSHLAMLPFLLGIVYEYLKLARKYLDRRMHWFALALLFLEPALGAQSMLMAYDIMLVYFFLAGINALLEKQMWKLSFFLVLLGLCSMRGIWAVVSIGLIQLLLARKEPGQRVLNYLAYLPFLCITAAWAIVHQAYTGWYFFSPVRQLPRGGEELMSARQMARQFGYLVWKIMDSGRVVLWVVLGWLLLQRYRHQCRASTPLNTLLLLVFCPMFVFVGLMVPLSNPSSSRYFMVVFALSGILVCYLLQAVSPGPRRWLMALLAFSLLSGNFWLYPERFSNGWDTSLKVLPYFGLKKEMTAFIREQHIRPEEVATQFPLIDTERLTDLTDADYQYTNAADGPLSEFHYYLHSNVCNTDLLPQIEAIKPTWKLLKEVRSGEVYLSLYENLAWGR